MIDVKELRIGNLIKSADLIIEIVGISSKPLGLLAEGELSNGHVGQLTAFDFENIIPIPLTEEWLLKFGFENIEYRGKFQKVPLSLEESAEGWRDYVGSIPYPPIKFVHQLQNLYFALTGQELTSPLP